jgi:uncharacterized membrane protein
MKHLCKTIYFELLPAVTTTTTMIGVVIGVSNTTGKTKPIENFANIIGYSSLGIMTGLTFPASFPLLGGYVVYKSF